MSKVQYPAYMHTGDGESAVLLRGHNLDPFEVEAAALDVLGSCQGYELEVHERHYAFSPRVKWCERLDCWGCDQNGEEFHAHWYEIRATDDPKWHYTEGVLKRYRPDGVTE